MSSPSSTTPSPPPTPPPHRTLIHPNNNKKHTHHNLRFFRVFRSVFRSFPIIPPVCKFPSLPIASPDAHNGPRITGTLFGYRKGHVSLAIQETPRCLPTLVIELAMQTSTLQKEMGLGTVRIALECDKRADRNDRTKVLDEPVWTMFCNGKKSGYGVRREASEEDLKVMELLKAVSMGAGVLPGSCEVEGPDGELAYMRAYFERVVGSRDCETFYMLSVEGNNGPELSIFFVRVG